MLFDPSNIEIELSADQKKLIAKAFNYCHEAVGTCELVMSDYKKGYISKEIAKYNIYGYGHHRILARK